MKHLGNVLYITTPQAYLSLDGETIVVKKEEETAMRLPLHNLESVVCFNYAGVSPGLMGACAERNIGLCFLRPSGRFLARVVGKEKGNLLLRKRQYAITPDSSAGVQIARSFLLGKIANSRAVVERAIRDHAMLVDLPSLRAVSEQLRNTLRGIQEADSMESLRGLEGNGAKQYFSVFGQLVLHQKETFPFEQRSRRPPLNNVNALLSFLYTLLTQEMASALEVVGLDPYVGFLHTDRPGRPSLALDMIEELRPVFADRLVLTLINRRQIAGTGFIQKESGGVLMDDETRKDVLSAWQKRKQEEIVHPFLNERIPFGLIPHVQATLMARYLRGDLDAYPPYFWN